MRPHSLLQVQLKFENIRAFVAVCTVCACVCVCGVSVCTESTFDRCIAMHMDDSIAVCRAKWLRSVIIIRHILNAVAPQSISKVKPKAQRSRMQTFYVEWTAFEMEKNLLQCGLPMLVGSFDPFVRGESIFCINYKLNGKYDWVMCRDGAQ